jgi:hypothetical protein
VSLATLRADYNAVAVPSYHGPRLRRPANVKAERVGPAIHAGVELAAAVTRALRNTAPASLPSTDAVQWSSTLQPAFGETLLEVMARDLWSRGVPVIPAEGLPTPKYQGLACIVDGRPVIVVGHEHDEPARVALWIAHECGHLVAGDCAEGAPVVDEDEDAGQASDMEKRADDYAWNVLMRGEKPSKPSAWPDEWQKVADKAAAVEQKTSVDAGVLVWSWTTRTKRYQDGKLALQALYRAKGARQTLAQLFNEHVDVENASETDAALLGCMVGGSTSDGPAG